MYIYIPGRFVIDKYQKIPTLVKLYIKKLYLCYSLEILEMLSSYDPSFITCERIRVHIDQEVPKHSIGISSVKTLSNEMNRLIRETIRREELSTTLPPFIQQQLILTYPNTIPLIKTILSLQDIRSFICSKDLHNNELHFELQKLKTIMERGINFINPMILAPLIQYISSRVI